MSDVATEAAQVVERAERDAWTDLYRAAPGAVVRAAGLSIVRLGEVAVLRAGAIDQTLFNRALGLGVGESATEEQLDEVLALARAEQRASFRIQLSPSASPVSLPSWLEARGLRATTRWAKMLRAPMPAAAVPTDLAIEQMGPASGEAFGRTACAAFGSAPALAAWFAAVVGRPGWRTYLAFDRANREPVASGALFVHDRIAWLGIAATLPAHRRRGAQGALLARRIDDAAEAGCRWIATETGQDTPERPNPSHRNMVRAGFELVHLRPNYG